MSTLAEIEKFTKEYADLRGALVEKVTTAPVTSSFTTTQANELIAYLRRKSGLVAAPLRR